MDVYEATRIVLSKIQTLDPENASKIMGLLLIQDHGEKEMIRLAFGPETLIHSVVLKARTELGISSMNSSAPPFYGCDLIDEQHLVKNPDFFWPESHRRSFSVADVCVGPDDLSGFGWKPCLYYARGYCKNGTNCRFLHIGVGDSPAGDGSAIGSPSSNFLLHQQQGGEEMNKLGRNRVVLERSDLASGMMMMNPVSRQIYLTFPADSTFREEDVSIYFSIYGPVQDVRIPYQQKRMFGFVTFVYPETVKLILAKGNPHFVCDARVLVKPYKEKGKIPDKLRKGDYFGSVCGSPTGLDSRDTFDIPIGPRMFTSSQELLWRRNLEEEDDLQKAIEIETKKLMGLQILDLKRQNHQRAVSAGAGAGVFGGFPSPTSHFCSPTVSLYSDPFNPKVTAQMKEKSLTIITSSNEESESPESGSSSLDHNLPDSPFASPKADSGAGDFVTPFLEEEAEAVAAAVENNNNKNTGSLMISAQSDLAIFNSWHFQVPRRLSSGNGAIGM